MRAVAPIAAAALLALAPGAVDAASPYAGREAREIASLSDEDVAQLLAGAGRGYALPAELNGYPGPRHVLDLAEELGLTEDQRAAIKAIFGAMEERARALGAEFVAAEAALDAAFANGAPTEAEIARLTAASAGVEARLRAVHLSAHLATRPLLGRHQLMLYQRARGYAAGAHGAGHGGH